MFEIKAKATKIIDNTSYPENVLIEVIDFEGQKHNFIEKWPVVSAQELDGFFPKDCTIACTLVEEKEMSCIVDTSKPWGMESEEGLTIFEISKEMLGWN